MDAIWFWLPDRLRVRDATRVFASDVHGCNLTTFYRLCEEVGPDASLPCCVHSTHRPPSLERT